MRGTTLERFEAKFTKSDGCWEWNAYKSQDGYGSFGVAGRIQKAHRVAYQLYVGEITEGLCVCHHCDNPSCVNPKHLFLGTNADNSHDRDNKGRGVHPDNSGEKHGMSKLVREQVVEIKVKISEGATQSDIAKEFGVARRTISDISNRRTWANL